MKLVMISLALMGLVACQEGKPTSQLKDDPAAEETTRGGTNPFPVDSLNEADIRTVAARIGYVEGDGHPDNGKCIGCHQNFNNIDVLDDLYNTTSWAYSCFDSGVSTRTEATAAIACLTNLDNNATDVKQVGPGALGFMAAGVHHKIFKDLFKTAGREADYEQFRSNAGMPLAGTPFADQDFENLLAWVLNYYPSLADFLTHDGPDLCRTRADTRIGKDLQAYVKRMSEGGLGWEHVNMARGVTMFACPDTNKHNCFTQKGQNGQDLFPRADSWKAPGLPGHMRLLHQYDETTNFWIRSSADGRFVGNGGQPSAIIDLQNKLSGGKARKITVEALYDPAFLPDNSGFIFQGDEHGSRICEQNILEHEDLVTLDFMQQGCSKGDLKIGLYQAIGSNLDSGDIRTLAGYFSSDSGYSINRDIAPLFGKAAGLTMDTIRRVNDGSFEKVNSRAMSTPYHGNWMMSPANQIATSIVSASTDGKARHGGYRLFMMNSNFGSKGKLPDLNDPSTALLCTDGGEKPNVSFDERMLAYYRYASQGQRVNSLESSSDILVYDLLRGKEPIALTQMPKGYYAQFPHYRSDGWLYFTVLNAWTEERFVVATDMSIHLEESPITQP
ncbi:MAG: hypothetical protein M3Q07_09405 [Pseudobdellovibrionaceae bacterium]|nr:hypothetical protein [Pseudobdellovibrionaceae bacterium]